MPTKKLITHQELERKLTPFGLAKIENNVYCGSCNAMVKIVGYEDNITINDIGDTILSGQCALCKNKVARYIEMGETDNRAQLNKKT